MVELVSFSFLYIHELRNSFRFFLLSIIQFFVCLFFVCKPIGIQLWHSWRVKCVVVWFWTSFMDAIINWWRKKLISYILYTSWTYDRQFWYLLVVSFFRVSLKIHSIGHCFPRIEILSRLPTVLILILICCFCVYLDVSFVYLKTILHEGKITLVI